VARGLCPVDLAPDALVPALEQVCRTMQARHGIACRLDVERGLTVRKPEHALHLYRIASEAVSNAAKHACCAQITVALAHESEDLVLRVSDDGRPGNAFATAQGGLGQGIMSYRADMIGGTLEVEAAPGGGRRVTCRVPDREALR